MFRIESYITPIILSHIDRYVKDFRPQDAQVSLWGGEVAFQNLDVRLDVLEDELKIPFSFLSGHIHELTVRVPWTKIASEPIQITINTIEFVIKLKDDLSTGSGSKRDRNRTEIVQEPPGYMASLVNKIANNISIKLHNIILKYVEEDIVVSMNIQLLSFDSADENWKPAFVDINSTKVLLKKVINVTDLTICLDQKNAMGKIDVCQEPILYRCTLQGRMLLKYNISTAHKMSVTRIDVFTDSMEVNISDQQYPMFVRLLTLALALKQGKINSPVVSSTSVVAPGPDGEAGTDGDQSIITWAWNMLPSIFPAYDENEEEVGTKAHIIHAGCYIKHLNITFKRQELMFDAIVSSTKKIKYHPMLRVSLSGVYSDTVMIGRRWFNVRGGISYIGVHPLGVCSCGQKHTQATILKTAVLFLDRKSFLDDSLMDGNCPENHSKNRIYDNLWDSYMSRTTEEYLLYRTPAIGFDIVHSVDIPDDGNRSTSDIGSDLEFSNLSEKYLCRIIVNNFKFKYNSSFVHIVDTLTKYLNSYDYAPYYIEPAPLQRDQLSPASTEDYEALINDIPIRKIELSIVKPVVEIYVPNHNSIDKLKHEKSIPFLSIESKRIDFNLIDPLYPNRLVHTTCQLDQPSRDRLLDNCFTKYKVAISDLSLVLVSETNRIMPISIIGTAFECRRLLFPDLWIDRNIPTVDGIFNVEKLSMRFNHPQILYFKMMSVLQSEPDPQNYTTIHSSTLFSDAFESSLPLIDVQFIGFQVVGHQFKETIAATVGCKSIQGVTYVPKTIEGKLERNNNRLRTFLISSNFEQNAKCLECWLQIPLDSNHITLPPIMAVIMKPIDVSFDPLFCDFLRYKLRSFKWKPSTGTLPKDIASSKLSKNKFIRKTSATERQSSRKSINRTESVHSLHSGSEPTTILTVTRFNVTNTTNVLSKKQRPFIDFSNWNRLAHCVVIQIDFEPITVYVPNRSVFVGNEIQHKFLALIEHKSTDVLVLKFPQLSFKSSHTRNSTIDFHNIFPIHLPDQLWTSDKNSFPWNIDLDDLECFSIQNNERFNLIGPIGSNVNLAVRVNDEKPENLSIFIHFDTKPIELILNIEQLKFTYTTVTNLLSLVTLSSNVNQTNQSVNDTTLLEISERSSSPKYHDELKEFFGTATGSDHSSEETLLDYDMKISKITYFFQWTLAKFSVIVLGETKFEKRQFVLDLEDIITGINTEDESMQLKFKIGHMNGITKTRPTDTDAWSSVDLMGITTRMASITKNKNHDTFFEVTVTKADTINVHRRWGLVKGKVKKRNSNISELITEVDVKMQNIDIRLNLDLLETFMPILKIFSQPTGNGDPINCSDPPQYTSVTDLPLLYFKCNEIRVFVPMLKQHDSCNVLIFKINSISVKPNVENPINRAKVRSDIYNKAAQLQIINIPGSKIEDRQYEMIFDCLSVCSGNWRQILQCMDSDTTSTSYNENPAFEWNNQTEKLPIIEINTIFRDFNISFIYAPCIVFKNILVCGQGMEINCLTDLVIEMTTHDIVLLNNFITELKRIQLNVSNNYRLVSSSSNSFDSNESILYKIKNKSNESLRSINLKNEKVLRINKFKSNDIPNVDYQYTDSGFESYGQYSQLSNDNRLDREQQSMSNIKTTIKAVPFDLSFVAGEFIVKVIHTIAENNHKSPNIVHIPLLKLTISQPNFLISQSIYEKVTKFSIFNLNVILFGPDKNDKFEDILFSSLPGESGLSGIAPSFLEIKESITRSDNRNISVNIRKPIVVYSGPKQIDKIISLLSTINELLMIEESEQENVDVEPIIVQKTSNGSKKIQLLKEIMFNASVFDFSIDTIQFIIQSDTKYYCRPSISKITAKCKFYDHPEKLQFNLNVFDVMLKIENHIVLNPISIISNGTLTQEKWKKNPIISFRLESSCIDVCLLPSSINHLKDAKDSMMECLEKYVENSEQKRKRRKHVQFPEIDDRYTQIPTPKLSEHKPIPILDEYYQDDLRAGAFQFIESLADNSLPLPYQIKIIIRDGGTICWKYPQPRALRYIQIFPVPFHTTSNATIKCNLEYYSDIHNSFMPYCTFNLSESVTQELQLPPRKIIAEIWQIVVHQPYIAIDESHFQGESSSDEEQSLNEKGATTKIDDFLGDGQSTSQTLFNIHPRALVGCMRIDSFFSASLVPNVQGVIDISNFTLSLKNDLLNKELPPNLSHFHHSDTSIGAHCFAELSMKKSQIHGCLFDKMHFNMYTQSTLSCNVLDYSYLSMEPLINEFQMKCNVEYGSSICTNIVTEPIRINYGPSISHTISVSESIWRQSLLQSALITYETLLTRFFICNCTTTTLEFGQYETDERIVLPPKQCCFYTFRTPKKAQNLIVHFLSNIAQNDCSPFSIGAEGIQYVKVNEFVWILVKTVKISTTQRIVYVKGLIEWHSMTEESFIIQYHSSVKAKSKNGPEFIIESKDYTSLINQSNDEMEPCMRMRFKNIDKILWSGDVPLNGLKLGPYLVKVPTNTKKQFISFWVRVVREKLSVIYDFDSTKPYPQRILIVIWPLFMIRSLLPGDIRICDMDTDEEYEIYGRSNRRELSVAGTQETEHQFSFNTKFDQDTRNKITLSYKAVNRFKFFEIPENFTTIERVIGELEREEEFRWPCNQRHIKDAALSTSSSINPQTALPIYKCLPSQPLSCTLMLDIYPWCLFVNLIEYQIRLTNGTDNHQCFVEANCIGTPFVITKSFTISIVMNNEWKPTSTIYRHDVTNRDKVDPSYTIPDQGSIIVKIDTGVGIGKYLLTSHVYGDIRTYIFAPFYTICNYSKYPLEFWPFCVPQNDTGTLKDRIKTNNYNYFKLPINQRNFETAKGFGISHFHNISSNIKNVNVHDNFNYFIVMRLSEGQQYAPPFLLNSVVNRRSVSIQSNTDGYIPLAVSIIDHDGQQFISIHDDLHPVLKLQNRTEYNLYVTEVNLASNANEASKAPSSLAITNGTDDQYFEWYRDIPSKGTIYFTPPSMDLNYPDHINHSVSIAFAMVHHERELLQTMEIRWSAPINIFEKSEFFMNLPLFGDVKVTVNNDEKTIHVIIEHINYQMEFNVKDIRTKLLNPGPSDMTSPIQSKASLFSHATQISRNDEEIVNGDQTVQRIHHHRQPTRLVFSIDLFIESISVNLFTDNEEKNCDKIYVLSVYFDDITMSYNGDDRIMKLNCLNFQIDNRLFPLGEYDFAVIVCSQVERKRPKSLPTPYTIVEWMNEYNKTSLLSLKIGFTTDFQADNIHCCLHPISAYIEDTYVTRLKEYFEGIVENVIYRPDIISEQVNLEAGEIIVPRIVVEQTIRLSDPLRLSFFRIEPLNVLLSVHSSMRMYLALDHSPLQFDPFERRDIYTLVVPFGYNLGMHYFSGALFGAGWIVGSLEIIGSPSGLARSLSTGIKDFISMPFEGFLRGPWDLLIGITLGSASLLRNITAGTVNSVTKLAASVARNLDRLSLDGEHLQRTEVLRRQRPQNISDGFTQGLTGLGISILGAVGGLARHTLEATTPVGIVSGFGKGLMGVVTKPISGAAELVALTGQGVLQSVGFNSLPMPRSNFQTTYQTDVRPSSAKILWKYLPSINGKDEVVFICVATMSSGSGFQEIIVALTTCALILITTDTDDIIEIITLEKVRSKRDDTDSTLIILEILNQSDPNISEIEFHHDRVLRYVQDTNDQLQTTDRSKWLPMSCGLLNRDTVAATSLIVPENRQNRRIFLYLDDHLAKYLIRYIDLLKKEINVNVSG